MSNFENRITEDSTEFEKAFLKIYDGSLWTALDKMKDWQPPKPLVVVPEITQKQADTLNDYKNGSGSLVNYLSTEIKKGDYDYFARAWLDGYTVEKPKENLYFVKLPGMTALDAYLCKSCSPGEIGYHEVYSSKEPNKISFSSRYDKKYSGGWQRQFTESEIKAIDERYLAFAVPV